MDRVHGGGFFCLCHLRPNFACQRGIYMHGKLQQLQVRALWNKRGMHLDLQCRFIFERWQYGYILHIRKLRMHRAGRGRMQSNVLRCRNLRFKCHGLVLLELHGAVIFHWLGQCLLYELFIRGQRMDGGRRWNGPNFIYNLHAISNPVRLFFGYGNKDANIRIGLGFCIYNIGIECKYKLLCVWHDMSFVHYRKGTDNGFKVLYNDAELSGSDSEFRHWHPVLQWLLHRRSGRDGRQ